MTKNAMEGLLNFEPVEKEGFLTGWKAIIGNSVIAIFWRDNGWDIEKNREEMERYVESLFFQKMKKKLASKKNPIEIKITQTASGYKCDLRPGRVFKSEPAVLVALAKEK